MKIKEITPIDVLSEIKLPLYSSKISAGFPSPAEDYIEKKLDLNELLIKHEAATFYVRVEGDSMINAGINSNDILIVDRSIEPQSGKIVVAILNGEFTVKRFVKNEKQIILRPENTKYKDIVIGNDSSFEIWGVVTFVIHEAK